MASTSTSQDKSSRMAAGQAIFQLNNKGLSKNDPRLKAVKACVDRAVRDVFMGHATVQLQGSTAKGTAVQNRSDWDFLVRLDATISFATQAQRMQVHDLLQQYLAAAGIQYSIRIAEKRLHLRFGSFGGVRLPDADVVLERFKLHAPATAPKSNVLAASNAGQSAARYIKHMASHFTNIHAPKRVEELVAAVDNYLRCQQGCKKEQLQGSAGFDKLLTATLQAIAGIGSIASSKAVQSAVQNAGLVTVHWRDTAQRVLNLRAAGYPWPGL